MSQNQENLNKEQQPLQKVCLMEINKAKDLAESYKNKGEWSKPIEYIPDKQIKERAILNEYPLVVQSVTWFSKSPKDIFQFAFNFNNRNQWDYNLASGKIIETFSDEMQIVYYAQTGLLSHKTRDFANVEYIEKDEEKQIYQQISTSIEHPDCPKIDQFERGHIVVRLMDLQPLNLPNNKKGSKLSILQQIDLKCPQKEAMRPATLLSGKLMALRNYFEEGYQVFNYSDNQQESLSIEEKKLFGDCLIEINKARDLFEKYRDTGKWSNPIEYISDKQIKVRSIQEEDPLVIQAVTWFSRPAKDVFQFVSDFQNRKRWDINIASAKTIQQLTNDMQIVYYAQTGLLRSQARDFVNAEFIEKDEEKQIYRLVCTGIQHPDCPQVQTFERAHILVQYVDIQPYDVSINVKGSKMSILQQIDMKCPKSMAMKHATLLPARIMELRKYFGEGS